MKRIVTLTVNPAIDYSAETDEVVPARKIRTRGERFDPGGGGINVARVVHILGGRAKAVHTAGGLTGPIFEGLLAKTGVEGVMVPVAGDTRISHTVRELATGHEFRFTPEGPRLSAAECAAVAQAVVSDPGELLVLSGSLAPGMPQTFYADIVREVRGSGTRVVLDTSGAALFHALQAGVHLVKPNKRELEHLMGRRAPDPADEERLAQDLARSGRAEIVALSLGQRGAVLATADMVWRVEAPRVPTVSTVGAGDSFLGAMVLSLARGEPVEEAFLWGVAAGAAAAMTPGTELCRRPDVEWLHDELVRRESARRPGRA